MQQQGFPNLTGLVLRAVLVISIPAWPGCERKERVLDVETPGVDVEVNRSDDGSLEIDVEDRRE